MILSNNTTSTISFYRQNIEIYIQVIVLVLILITTVIGNAVVIAIIYLDYRLHRPGFYFLANLSTADLLVGSVYVPFYIAAVLKQSWEYSETWCKLHAVTISTSFNASLITLCFISIDRLLAITKPLSYQTFMTSQRSAILISFGWIHSLFWAIVPLVGWGEITLDPKTNTCRPNFGAKGFPSKTYAMLMSLFTFAIPTIAMIVCYCRIFGVARQQVKLIKKNSVGSSRSAGSQNNRVYEFRALKTVLMVLGVFIAAWLPYTIVSTGKLVTRSSWDVGPSVANAVLTITLINGCFNPVIYSLRDKRFKSGLKKIVCLRWKNYSQDMGIFSTANSTTKSSGNIQDTSF